MKSIMYVIVTIVIFAAAAPADWQPGDPHKMHYPQLPNLDNGMDVLNSTYVPAGAAPYQKFLADDFLCTETGLIRDVHIWGSWLDDNNPTSMEKVFQLALYSNVPASQSTTGYSMPGELLWEQRLKPTEILYATAQEEFYDPNPNAIIGTDTQVWQYNFLIPDAIAYRQQQGNIYWLGVTLLGDVNGDGIVDTVDTALMSDQLNPFAYGWKTSLDKFEDDAVWIDIDPYGSLVPDSGMLWNELIGPTGASLDLAFVITPEPGTICLMLAGTAMLLRKKK